MKVTDPSGVQEAEQEHETLRPGIYSFRIGLLDPRTGEPSVRLAIRGRASDGWYDLGSIGVE